MPEDLDDDIRASAFRTAAIRGMADGAFPVFQQKYDDILRGTYSGSLLEDSNANELADSLRKIGTEHVYPIPSTLRLD